MKNAWSFFPEWVLWIYLPLHIYVFFQVAAKMYPGPQLGYALIPLFLVAAFSGGIVYVFLTVVLYKVFGNRTLVQVVKEWWKRRVEQGRELRENLEDSFSVQAEGDNDEMERNEEFRSTLSDEYSTKPVSEVSKADGWVRKATKVKGRNIGRMLAIFFFAHFLYFLYLNRHIFLFSE